MESNRGVKATSTIDGGWGWMVVLGSFIAYFIADGWSYSFGVFYPELLGYFQEGAGKTALIGALLYGTPMLMSPFMCALTTAYGCRFVCILGGLVTGLSFVLSAFANSVGFLCFSSGILGSLGLALTYIPAIFAVTFHFEHKRGLATGLAVMGSGFGAFAFPPLMEHLLDVYAWRGMLLIFGGICFNIIPAGGLFRPPPVACPGGEETEKASDLVCGPHVKQLSGNVLMPQLHGGEPALKKRCSSLPALSSDSAVPVNHGQIISLDEVATREALVSHPAASSSAHCSSSPDLYINHRHLQPVASQQAPCENAATELRTLVSNMLDKSLLHNTTYMLYVCSGFLMFLWIGVPYVYLVDYALKCDISSQKASFLLSYIAIGRTVGMIFLGWVGDLPQVNVVLLYGVFAAGCGVGTMCIPFCTNYASLAVFAVTFGFCISVTYVLPMMSLVAIVGLEKSSSAFGIFQLVQGMATLLGTPVAGWLYDRTNSYGPSFYISGAWLILSGLMLLPAPIMLGRTNRAEVCSPPAA